MKEILKSLLIRTFDKFGYLLAPKYKIFQNNYYLTKRLEKIITEYEVDCIIDVGANVGQFGQFLRNEVGYKGLIISFEPDPNVFQTLNSTISTDKLWIAYNEALSDEAGELKFNIMKNSQLNSFLNPFSGDTRKYAGVNVVESQIDITVKKLDDIFERLKNEYRFNNVLLKIDTQGFDLKVFSGASESITSIVGVLSEISVLPIYEDMPSFNDSLGVFQENGYEVSGIYPVEEDRFPYAIEFDCLYLKR